MDFIDLVNEELETDKNLNEFSLQISPAIAIAAFKDKTIGELKRKAKGIKDTIIKTKNAIKGEALLAKEKVSSPFVGKIGKGEDATLYRLTKEQMEVMSQIYKKYGKYLVKDILAFRKNSLAPYQLIKRLVKKNKSLTSKETHGISKEEFSAALESGRKKIEMRGDNFFKNLKELNEKLAKSNERIRELETIKNDFINNKKIDNTVLTRVFEKYEVTDEDLQGYTPDELRKSYEAIEASNRLIFQLADKQKTEGLSSADFTRLNAAIKERGSKISGEAVRSEREKEKIQISSIKRSLDLVSTEKDKFFRNGKFNVALGKYFFRREILEKLRPGKENSIFTKTYETIIDEMMKKEKDFKDQVFASIVSSKRKTAFNDKEEKVWGTIPTARDFSGNLADYYQKLKEEDFFDVQHVKKSDELLKAENDIETEIRRFERKLAKIVSPEDLSQLKKYRLINNMISIGELKNPQSLFKTRAEIQAMAASSEDDTTTDITGDVPEIEDAEENEKRVITKEEYYRRLKDLATKEYDSYKEMSDAKEKAKSLQTRIKEQGDTDTAEEYEDILNQFILRKEIGKIELSGHKYDDADILDINDITTLAKKIIRKNYTNSNDAKQDVNTLKEMIEKYKKENPKAEENIDEIQFLMKRIDRKLQSSDFGTTKDIEAEQGEI